MFPDTDTDFTPPIQSTNDPHLCLYSVCFAVESPPTLGLNGKSFPLSTRSSVLSDTHEDRENFFLAMKRNS